MAIGGFCCIDYYIALVCITNNVTKLGVYTGSGRGHCKNFSPLHAGHMHFLSLDMPLIVKQNITVNRQKLLIAHP